MSAFGCDEFRELAPDLALGLLAGNERGAAIGHLAACTPCRNHLDGLVKVTDQLLLLAPAIEPEIGFESRVMARLADDGAFRPGAGAAVAKSRHWWSRPVTVALAAAVLAIMAVTGLAAGLNRARDEGRSSALGVEAHAANQLLARTVVVWADGGKSTCQLVAFPQRGSQPARLVVHLDEPASPSDSYQVFAVPTSGGPAVLIGTIDMVGGQGILSAAIPKATGPVDAVRVMEGPGNTRYWATFAAV